jgi:hypothetical protein
MRPQAEAPTWGLGAPASCTLLHASHGCAVGGARGRLQARSQRGGAPGGARAGRRPRSLQAGPVTTAGAEPRRAGGPAPAPPLSPRAPQTQPRAVQRRRPPRPRCRPPRRLPRWAEPASPPPSRADPRLPADPPPPSPPAAPPPTTPRCPAPTHPCQRLHRHALRVRRRALRRRGQGVRQGPHGAAPRAQRAARGRHPDAPRRAGVSYRAAAQLAGFGGLGVPGCAPTCGARSAS